MGFNNMGLVNVMPPCSLV